jgi:ferritin-like metal-binding protein YciE
MPRATRIDFQPLELTMPKFKELHNLFIHELKDVASAEHQLTNALPKLAKGTENKELRAAFEDHHKETKDHYDKVIALLESFDSTKGREKCSGMAGIVQEGESMLKEEGDPVVLDCGLIASAQKAEHYEIASYGTLRTWAKTLGYTEAAQVFEEIIEQEGAADKKLTKIAKSLNTRATAAQS